METAFSLLSSIMVGLSLAVIAYGAWLSVGFGEAGDLGDEGYTLHLA